MSSLVLCQFAPQRTVASNQDWQPSAQYSLSLEIM